MKTFELNNKQTIPAVGFGVFMIPNDGPTYDATLAALKQDIVILIQLLVTATKVM